MSRRRTRTRTTRTPGGAPAAPPTASGAAPAGAQANAAGQKAEPAASFHLTRRTWIAIYVVIFLAIQAALALFFVGLGGEERVRLKMLDEAAQLRQRGDSTRALAVLERYGQRWPGAYGTQNFERRLGDYHFDAGNHADAAQHYAKSVAANPKVWDTRALAGQAYWLAGEKETAVRYFREELEQGNPESDLAQYHLGLWELEQGNVIRALSHMQDIKDRAAYEQRLADMYTQIERDILEPSRAQAAAAAREFLDEATPRTSASDEPTS